MPTISMFYGIIVRMFFLDNKEHKLPHIHVEYQDDKAVVGIPGGELITGSFPKAQLRLVQAWIEIHKDELMADWKLAVEGQSVFKIEALKWIMYELNEIKPLADFILECRFSNGILKTVDLKPFLNKEAFLPLKNDGNFKKAVNKNYFVEWLGLDIDLSADTLWHLGI